MKSLIVLTALLGAAMVASAQQPRPQHFWHVVESAARPAQIWEIWMAVERWKEWDTGLQSASLDGPMELGQTGMLISDKGKKVKFTISEFKEGEAYAFTMKLPLGRFTIRRSLTPLNEGARFTHDVRFSGFSKGLFGRLLGKAYMQQLPMAMENIRRLAEELSGDFSSR